MIEVFKTNVADKDQASALIYLMHKRFPGNKINIDLHDCDKILRIDGTDYIVDDIKNFLTTKGFECEILTS